MNQESAIELAIMRRVYVIWFCRQCAHSVWAKLFALGLLFAALYWQVSPAIIWQNAHTAGGVTNYYYFAAALMNTEIFVQLVLLALALILSWLVKSLWSRYAGLFARFSLATLSGLFSRVRS